MSSLQDFGRRLQRDVKKIVDTRMLSNITRLGTMAKSTAPPLAIEVNVISHAMQRYAVWFGGSMLSATVCVITCVFLYASEFTF